MKALFEKNYLAPVYEETINCVKSIIEDHPVYFILDETTDSKKRYILNVLVAPLTGDPVKPMLLKTYCLEKTNNTTIMQSFNDACTFLWAGSIKYDRVWLVLTDQASYMLTAFKALKMLYNKMHHITCIAHALHRVCEYVRSEYCKANRFVGEMKKVLLKSPYRIQQYQEITKLPLPPDPVVTRWGTWINAAVFYCEHFNNIKDFLNQLEDSESVAVVNAKLLSNDEGTLLELFRVHNFKFLIENITKLETQSLSREEQWNILQQTKDSLSGAVLKKLELSLTKNPDIRTVADPTQMNDLEFSVKTKYAPLVTVDVERSFSQYKDILSSKRENLSFRHIEMLNIIKFNSFLFRE